MYEFSWHCLDRSGYQALDARIKKKASFLDDALFRTMERLIDTFLEEFSLFVTDVYGFDYLGKS